jgi:hypothetical protein
MELAVEIMELLKETISFLAAILAYQALKKKLNH